MKWIIILGLLIVVWMFVIVRFRRQIQTAIYLWKLFQSARQPNRVVKKPNENEKALREVPLVKCSKCGTWTPQTAALNLRSKTFYCSTNCMESAAVKVS